MRPVAGEALTLSESDLQIPVYEPNCYVVEKAISRSTATQPVFSAVGLPLGLKRPRYFLSRSLKQPVTQAERRALQRVIKTAERITGTTLPSMDFIYSQRCRKRAVRIIRDSLHPAHPLLNNKHCKYRLRHSRADSVITHTTRFFNSFFPAAVRLMALTENN